MLRFDEASGVGMHPSPGPSSRCRIGTQGDKSEAILEAKPEELEWRLQTSHALR